MKKNVETKNKQSKKKMTQGKALTGGPDAAGWMQQRDTMPEFLPLHDSADSDSDRENKKRQRV